MRVSWRWGRLRWWPERHRALELLCRKYAPDREADIPAAIQNGAIRTGVIRILLTEIHGKRKPNP